MTHLSLSGGTDVAAMALFSIDAASERSDPETLDRLEAQGFMLRFELGGDGGYLLHAYIDEPVPDSVMKYCELEETRTKRLQVGATGIGFGGAETVVRGVDPNLHMRTDARVPAGEYDVTAYLTNYPDELLEAELDAVLGRGGRRLLDLPGYIIGLGVVVVGGCLLVGEYVAAALVSAAIFAGMKWGYFRNPRIQQLQRDQEAIEMKYPNIVVQMGRCEVRV
jgi:hypothetical protein